MGTAIDIPGQPVTAARETMAVQSDDCSVAQTTMFDDEVFAAIFAALGHQIRLSLWRALVPYGDTGLSAGALSARMMIVPSSLSFHLRMMREAGLVAQRRSSRHMVYSVQGEVVASLQSFFTTMTAVPNSEQPDHFAGDRLDQPESVFSEVGCATNS
jgi:DNA-binding transcriptional ArsR family regulator